MDGASLRRNHNFNRFCLIHLCDGQTDRRTGGNI